MSVRQGSECVYLFSRRRYGELEPSGGTFRVSRSVSGVGGLESREEVESPDTTRHTQQIYVSKGTSTRLLKDGLIYSVGTTVTN